MIRGYTDAELAALVSTHSSKAFECPTPASNVRRSRSNAFEQRAETKASGHEPFQSSSVFSNPRALSCTACPLKESGTGFSLARTYAKNTLEYLVSPCTSSETNGGGMYTTLRGLTLRIGALRPLRALFSGVPLSRRELLLIAGGRSALAGARPRRTPLPRHCSPEHERTSP